MLTKLRRRIMRGTARPFRIELSVLEEIRSTVGALPAEQGGVLGGRPEDGVVTEFYFDRSARRTAVMYTPDDRFLNRLFAQDWNPRGIRVMGFVHSHPGLRRPSAGDLAYCRQILERIPDLARLLTPIIISSADSSCFEIHPFAVTRSGGEVDLVPLKMKVLDGEGRRVADWERLLGEVEPSTTDGEREARTEAPVAHDERPRMVLVGGHSGPSKPTTDVSATFKRVTGAYDLETMAESRVIHIGTGGAAAFTEDLARAGVGQHVLIDSDVVSETNLATQQVYRRDLGRKKVDAIAERLRDINPEALVMGVSSSLDAIDDGAFAILARGEIDGRRVRRVVLCGLTDDFYAQARVHRLALQLGIPSLCAQVYREGRGGEITFTHPDVTPACHRCVLRSRYEAYLEAGYKNTVTSDGTPIFSTGRLNALKGFVTLALLHHGTDHPRWGRLLERIGSRNLIQIRMDPDLSQTVGIGVFNRVLGDADSERLLFDEAVWLPQEPEGPEAGRTRCPDCGGTGNLRDAIGTFRDTRIMKEVIACGTSCSPTMTR